MCPHIGPIWLDVSDAGRKTRASYILLPLPKADSHLRLFACKSLSAFLLLKRRCPLWRQQHFHSNGAGGYNTLHFATQSRVPKGGFAPFGNPTTKQRYAPRQGVAYRCFLVLKHCCPLCCGIFVVHTQREHF